MSGDTWEILIAMTGYMCIGIIGRALFPISDALNTASAAEGVFIQISQSLLPPLLAGIVMAGILAATISSADSYLLIAASAASKNLFEGIFKQGADDKSVMKVSRLMLLAISLIGCLIAWDEKSVIFDIVSFAWAGFGATFGPIIILSLFWRRTNRAGAVAGMLSGGIMVFVWKLLIRPAGGIFGIYELLPAFLISLAVIVVVSLITPKPSTEMIETFDSVAGKA